MGVKNGLVVNIGDIKLDFSVSDFQWTMRVAQGTNSKHSTSKALFFITAQPVTRFNHSFGTSHREDLKWPFSFVPLALRAFPHCQAAVCSVRWGKQALVRLSLIKVLVWVKAQHLTCFILSVLAFTPLLWWAGVRPACEALQEQAGLGDLYQKSQELLLKACLALFQHHSPSLLLFQIDFCLKMWILSGDFSLPTCLCGPSLSCLTLQSDNSGCQLRLLLNFSSCLSRHNK